METFTVTKAIISNSKVIFKMSSKNINNNINNKTNNKMETRKISLTLEEAREFYKSNNDTLKALALKAFTEEELKHSFKDIKSFKDACIALNLDYDDMFYVAKNIGTISKASSAMFELNIIRTALNLNYDLGLTKSCKGSRICMPHNPFISNTSNRYKKELELGKAVIIGSIKYKGTIYSVLNDEVTDSMTEGLGTYYSTDSIGFACADFGFLGCANKEIAEHFGKYFGMLITEAKYGDIPGFEVINPKYKL